MANTVNQCSTTSGTEKTWYNKGTKGLAKSVCSNKVLLYRGYLNILL